MPLVNGAHVAERKTDDGSTPRPIIPKIDNTIALFLSLFSFLQVGPACRNVNFYPDLEESSPDSKF